MGGQDEPVMNPNAPTLEPVFDDRWHSVAEEGAPIGVWLETKFDGEKGTNICLCHINWTGEEPEWIELRGGRTTVTHHSFVAPTHWRWLREPMDQKAWEALWMGCWPTEGDDNAPRGDGVGNPRK